VVRISIPGRWWQAVVAVWWHAEPSEQAQHLFEAYSGRAGVLQGCTGVQALAVRAR